MARYAILDTGRIANIAEAGADFADLQGWILAGNSAIGDLWDGIAFSKPPELLLDRIAASKAIDAAVLAVYAKPTTLGDEYKEREAAALTYKVAGYTGTVPARVMGFSAPAGMTPHAAADLILAQAAQIRGALAQLADLRMQKYAVTRAATEADALAAYDTTMAAIAAIAAAL